MPAKSFTSGLLVALLWLISGNSLAAEKIVLVAGGEKAETGIAAVEAQLRGPFAVEFDDGGAMFIAEIAGHRVLKVDAQGKLTTIAGTGAKGNDGDGGPGTKATFNEMHSIALGNDGTIYIADTSNNRIRCLDPKSGAIAAFAGTGVKGYSGDGGPAAKAQFKSVYCVAFDAGRKNLFVADLDNFRVRRIDIASGIVDTVAGNGKQGVPKDGALATDAPLVAPRAVAVDRAGNVYVLERGGNALRVVDTKGHIRTVAGTGEMGLSGDGGPALAAKLNGPKHLCIDLEDNVIIADTENNVIRKYLPSEGKIVRVAGTGKKGQAGIGGPPLEVELAKPHGVHIDRNGVLTIADSENDRVLRVIP